MKWKPDSLDVLAWMLMPAFGIAALAYAAMLAAVAVRAVRWGFM